MFFSQSQKPMKQAPQVLASEPPEVTRLREKLASGTVQEIGDILKAIQQKLTGGLTSLFKNDRSLFQALGSRLVRSSSPDNARLLLQTISEIDSGILSITNNAGRNLSSETATFTHKLRVPEAVRNQLTSMLKEFGVKDDPTPLSLAQMVERGLSNSRA